MLPDRVTRILTRLRDQGHDAFLVGGCVRDTVLGVTPSDYDIVTDALPDRVCQLFPDRKVTLAGAAFPVCMVDHVEVATFRSRSNTEAVAGGLVNDLARRDLTVNSMAMDPVSGLITDPFGGQADVRARIIRFTGSADERIAEDPCRMLRACRFAVRIRGQLAGSAVDAICRNRYAVAEVAAERLRAEVEKALAGPKPGDFFRLLADLDILSVVFPCLDACRGIDGGPYHAETLFEHAVLAADAVSAKYPRLRLAALLHDTGKPAARKVEDGRVTFNGHEKQTRAAEADLSRLRFSQADQRYVIGLIHTHMRPLNENTTDRAVGRLLKALKDADVDWRDFVRIRIADRRANLKKTARSLDEIRGMVRRIRAVLYPASGPSPALTTKDLAVSGADVMQILNLRPGPAVGRILKQLLDTVVDDPSRNTRDQLKALIEQAADHDS